MPHYSPGSDSRMQYCDSTFSLHTNSTSPPLFAPLPAAPSEFTPRVHISGPDKDPEVLSKAWPVDPSPFNFPAYPVDAADRPGIQSGLLQVPAAAGSLKLPPSDPGIDIGRVRAWLESGDASEHEVDVLCEQLQRRRTPSCLSSCSLSTTSCWADPSMDERFAQPQSTSQYGNMTEHHSHPDANSSLQPPSSNDAILAFSQRGAWSSSKDDSHEPAAYEDQGRIGSHGEAPRRTNSRSRKRGQDSIEGQSTFDSAAFPATDASTTIAKRVLHKARSKSPRLDSRRNTHDSSSAAMTAWIESEDGGASRARSRSDAVAAAAPPKSGQAMLAVPSSGFAQHQWLDAGLTLDPEDDEFAIPGSCGPLTIAEAPAAATMDAFQDHIHNLNPGLDSLMVERFAQEQMKRHQRLSDFQSKHSAAVARNSCPSGARCGVLGQGPNYDLSTFVTKRTDTAPAIFHVIQPDGSHEVPEEEIGTSIPATFPDGIPIPPITRLPAEFECPLCFTVKKFMKPSDWTKHVHEDVQPFTCTFPSCAEPKSFKRKADWVRHESERHRHLESWRCDMDSCNHCCFRRDNFVQHLVREHRLPEPKAKPGRGGKNAASKQDDIISHLVEKCRFESTQSSLEEPCRFCGNICASWKKHQVHLAAHHQQISMPILELLGHHLPRSEHGTTQHRAVTHSTSLPLPGSRPHTQAPEHSWSTPLMGPAISITNTAGATGLEHEAAAGFYRHDQRAVSETPSYYSGMQPDLTQGQPQYDSDASFLHPSTTSSPYLSSRSASLGQPSPLLTAYSSEPGMLGVAPPQPAWASSETRLPLLQQAGGDAWHDHMMAQPPQQSSSGGLSFGQSSGGPVPGGEADDGMDLGEDMPQLRVPSASSAGMPPRPGMPEPGDPAWMARAYAAASKERSRATSRPYQPPPPPQQQQQQPYGQF